MANPDARFGLVPKRHINGSPWNGATIRCYVSASYATALFIGDPVDFDTTAADVPTAPRVPTVIRSAMTDGTYTIGVITSFEPNPDNLTLQYRPASTARYCNVCCDPTVIYWIRGDASGAATKSKLIGANAYGVNTHAGDTATGLSGLELVEGSILADASCPMMIVGIADIPDNEFDGSTSTRVIFEVLLTCGRFQHLSTASPLGVTPT
jgi:hypothetical protein